MTSVYFIIGTPNSGRRGIVRDLIANGLGEHDKSVVLLAAGETAVPVDDKLAALPDTTVQRWQWVPPELPAIEGIGNATVFLSPIPASARSTRSRR